MKLETSRKVLRITGILTIIGGVITIASGLMVIFMGNAATQMLDFASNLQLQNGSDALLEGGGDEIFSGILSLLEGGASYSAGKHGKHTTAAYVFALLGMIGAILQGYVLVRAGAFGDMEKIISLVVTIILNLIIFTAASKVRKASKNN